VSDASARGSACRRRADPGGSPARGAGAADYGPTPANLEARRWFQDAKFGLFVHWGVYSTLMDGEWVMHQRRISVADYEKLPGLFNPH
jgi:alpha-L-fucosidase